jgi:hypothetical protein
MSTADERGPQAPRPVALQIQHATTADDLFGCPWPPSDGGGWAVVRRAGGFTTWRLIQIKQSISRADDCRRRRRGSSTVGDKHMDASKYYGSPFLKVADVKLADGEKIRATITNVEEGQIWQARHHI